MARARICRSVFAGHLQSLLSEFSQGSKKFLTYRFHAIDAVFAPQGAAQLQERIPMIRKIKTLGIAVVAVLALSAVVASAASAANFTASSYPTSATAASAIGNDDFKTEAGSVECKGHFHVGPLSAASETVTVVPTYSECRAFGFLNATVHMNECDYTFYTSGSVDLNCPTGKAVAITASTCEVQIGAQSNLSKVDLANSGTGVSAQATVGGINYTVTKDGFGCPFAGTGAKTGATYTQNNAVQVNSTNGATIDIG
jgi:hypothetical protein